MDLMAATAATPPRRWSLAGRESLLGIAGRKLAKFAATSGRRARTALLVALRLCLQVAGLALISIAAWGVAWQLGVFVAGLSCFVLEWLVKRE
jgi:hypothetical protein